MPARGGRASCDVLWSARHRSASITFGHSRAEPVFGSLVMCRVGKCVPRQARGVGGWQRERVGGVAAGVGGDASEGGGARARRFIAAGVGTSAVGAKR